MTVTRLVGIQLGTASVRVRVYEPNGEVTAEGYAPIKEQTTVAWERAIRSAMPELPEKGICSVASTSGTLLLVDEYGEPVFPPEMYYESAPDRPQRLLESGAGGDLSNWGAISSRNAPLTKLLRLRREHPDQFENVEWVLSPTTWLLYRLRYGNSTRWRNVETDWTNAMKFGANITSSVPEWHTPLFEDIDLSSSLLPAIRPPGSFIGVAESGIAKRLGIDGLVLHQGMTDGTASVLANGCFEHGNFSVTFWATSVIKCAVDSITPLKEMYHHRHPLDGYILGGFFDTGSVLRWYFDHVLDIPPDHGFELAKSVSPDQEYDVFLQGLSSESAGGTSILGVQSDVSLSTHEVRGRLVRGIMTGIVLAEWAWITRMQEHLDITADKIWLMNHGAPSLHDDYNWWNDLRSQIWNHTIVEMEPRMTSGLLIPAALIASVYSDVDEAKDRLLRRRTRIEPDAERSARYDERRADYLNRWQQVADLQTDW